MAVRRRFVSSEGHFNQTFLSNFELRLRNGYSFKFRDVMPVCSRFLKGEVDVDINRQKKKL